jgi:hypothetical protein
MKRAYTSFTLFLGLLLTTLPVRAGEYAADFLHLGTGAAALGMGGAYGTSKSTATSFYWNPALVLDEQHAFKLYLESVSLFDGLSTYQTAAGQLRIKEAWALSLGVQHQAVTDIPRFTDLADGRDLSDPDDRSTGLPAGFFGSQSTAFTMGLSHEFWFDIMLGGGLVKSRIPARLAVGGAIKLIDQRIDTATASGQASDFGFKLMIGEPVTAGSYGRKEFVLAIARQNMLAGQMAWDTASGHEDPLPGNTKVGISYLLDFPSLALGFRAALEHDSAYEGTWHLGYELDYRQRLYLRTGVVGETFSHADPTFGAGIQLSAFLVDYAYNTHALGLTHRVALEFQF